MLQYFSKFKLPHGNAAFGERRLPEIVPLGKRQRQFPIRTKISGKFQLAALPRER
jgi:hypothetical protein